MYNKYLFKFESCSSSLMYNNYLYLLYKTFPLVSSRTRFTYSSIFEKNYSIPKRDQLINPEFKSRIKSHPTSRCNSGVPQPHPHLTSFIFFTAPAPAPAPSAVYPTAPAPAPAP